VDALAPADVVDVWETGRGRHPVDRALALLAATAPAVARDELAALSVGRRDAELLRLRQATYGDRFEVQSACPACGERIELQLRCADLLATQPAAEVTGEHGTEVAGYQLTYRMPDSFDLAAIAALEDVAAARHLLLERCVLDVRGPSGEEVEVIELPERATTAVAEAMAALDPQAEILLDLTCPQCAHGWQSRLDIALVLWAEVTAQARRVLLEVDQLARAYGWSEDEILHLSPARRATYLELVGG
jgi:hypothetical protein